jgi:uncharacterized protein YabN with tetrapyrrole methylase and pyrophosphatase domain
MSDSSAFDDALKMMRDLRRRCDWDAAQTHDSLRPYLVEEAHELDEAIGGGNDDQIREELGMSCSRSCSTASLPRNAVRSMRPPLHEP